MQTAADGTIGLTVTLNGGALRFDVRRSTGSRANYHFVATTSQLAIRGTVGLLSYVPGGDTTVVCLACEALRRSSDQGRADVGAGGVLDHRDHAVARVEHGLAVGDHDVAVPAVDRHDHAPNRERQVGDAAPVGR